MADYWAKAEEISINLNTLWKSPITTDVEKWGTVKRKGFKQTSVYKPVRISPSRSACISEIGLQGGLKSYVAFICTWTMD